MPGKSGTTRVKGGTPSPKALTKRNLVRKARADKRRFARGGYAARVGKSSPFPPLRST